MTSALPRQAANDAVRPLAKIDPSASKPPLAEPQPLADRLDRELHANLARLTGGLSPGALATAYLDWLVHLAGSPGKQLQLGEDAARKAAQLLRFAAQRALNVEDVAPPIAPSADDNRFKHESWGKWPFDFLAQSFLMTEAWWREAATGVRGVAPAHARMVDFMARQMLDMMAPSNLFWANPQAIEATIQAGGMNLWQGWRNWVDDLHARQNAANDPDMGEFVVGRDLAATPGKIVYKNELIELIRYAPTTDQVHPEPLLIVPAWIMKYYILDLSQKNSLVKYLTDQGFCVFMISWRNPITDDRDLGFDDYRRLGVMAALDAISALFPRDKIHTAGYCLGGTLLSIACAAMARFDDNRIASMSMLAAQVDFTEAGELTLFISPSQVAFLEDLMWRQGYLDATQMSGAFHLLRPNDLIWSRMIHDYWMGERGRMVDIMAWNADATRMPYRMHSEYLRKLFMNNDLAERRFCVDGHHISISDIRAPIFALGTTRDHVAPWKSVFKIHYAAESDVTFALTEGGHNGGVVAEPGKPGRRYWIKATGHRDHEYDPEGWRRQAEAREGSWWEAWAAWLKAQSGPMIAPPPMRGAKGEAANRLANAPGDYVFIK